MGTAQEEPALGQVSWDREQWHRKASSSPGHGTELPKPVEWWVVGQLPAVVAPGGTGQGEDSFSLLPGRAGHGPTHHPGPLHHHDTAVSCDLCRRGFVPLPQNPLPYQDEDPLLEQLSPDGELGCGGAGGHHPGGPGPSKACQPTGGGNVSVPNSRVPQVVSVVSCFGLWFPRSMMVVEMATTA